MRNEKNDVEPPSCCRPPLFMIGQDSRGNWVVQDQSGVRGGLFVDRTEALKFARSENGNRPPAVVTVNGAFELNMNFKPAITSQPASFAPPQRRVA
jgi:hypothetical protein